MFSRPKQDNEWKKPKPLLCTYVTNAYAPNHSLPELTFWEQFAVQLHKLHFWFPILSLEQIGSLGLTQTVKSATYTKLHNYLL